MKTTLIALHAAARATWGLPASLPAGVFIGLDGTAVAVRCDGTAYQLPAPGHPRAGIAADPCAARRA